MEGGSENSVLDTRFEYMGSFVQKTLKLKPEKWMRLATVEEHKSTIKEFLDRPHPMQLIVVLTQAAQLIPQTSFPLTQLKSKGIFGFIKIKGVSSERKILLPSFQGCISSRKMPYPFPKRIVAIF